MYIASQELIVPPQETKVYNKYWIHSLQLYGDFPESKLTIVLKRFRTISETEVEYSNEEPRILEIPNILEKAATDSDFANLVGLIFNEVQKLVNEEDSKIDQEEETDQEQTE